MKFERYGIGIAKGLRVTIKHLFRHPVTVQYPEQRLNTSRRIRGSELICVESCPYEALFMGYAYERSKYRRGELVQANEMLLASAERQPSGYMYPEIASELPRQTLLVEGELRRKSNGT